MLIAPRPDDHVSPSTIFQETVIIPCTILHFQCHHDIVMSSPKIEEWTIMFILLSEIDCDNNPCLHGATCKREFEYHICKCTDGYLGGACELGKI